MDKVYFSPTCKSEKKNSTW